MRLHAAVASIALLTGCTFNTTVDHVDGAPAVPRSDSAVVVATPPKSAILLGTVTVRGNAHMIGSACEQEAVSQARQMGATHVIVRPVDTSASRGVRCIADAYYLGPIVPG